MMRKSSSQHQRGSVEDQQVLLLYCVFRTASQSFIHCMLLQLVACTDQSASSQNFSTLHSYTLLPMLIALLLQADTCRGK